MEVSRSMISKISPRYDMSVREMREIYEAAGNDRFGMICAAFNLGYLRGGNAEKNKVKKQMSTI